jgi:hypothetical protein
MAVPTCRQGWLRKNHRGGPWAKGVDRYFVSDGFQVSYYAKAIGRGKPPAPKGHFDLRNVVTMQPSPDPLAAEANAIERMRCMLRARDVRIVQHVIR